MSLWVERVLREFPADLDRFWIVADPDNVLLDETILVGLREQGFEVMPFEDSIAFRADYEERYRSAWDAGSEGPSKALILQYRGNDVEELPWDYLRQSRRVSLSLADLFPRLNYGVVRQLGADQRAALFDAQLRYVSQSLGEGASKEFVLTHIFRLSPHLISRAEDLWRELLRIHYRGAGLPEFLALHIENVLQTHGAFKRLPIAELFSSKSALLALVQSAWARYFHARGVSGTRTGEPGATEVSGEDEIPFDHPDIRAIVHLMFLEGALHPLEVPASSALGIPEWARSGLVQDPLAKRNLTEASIKNLLQTVPAQESSYRDWMLFAQRMGEVISRFHSLESSHAMSLKAELGGLQGAVDVNLCEWLRGHYSDLSSLSAAKAPVMVHHVPRFLAMRRTSGESRIALLVFDGLAIDQWVQIRECLMRRSNRFAFDEGACFAWLPTLTSVSRQALFSGLRPREFSESIETTAQEPSLWSRHWQDQGLRANELLYRKGIKRSDQLADLDVAVAAQSIKMAGIVVDTVDEIVHGAVLGKRGIANQIFSWCETGFVDQLFDLLLSKGYSVYVTADHGNVEAVGQGRPSQGIAPEVRGERVRTFRSEELLADALAKTPKACTIELPGIPKNWLPLFSDARTAFVPENEQVVVHGGMSIEELLVPFVKVSYAQGIG